MSIQVSISTAVRHIFCILVILAQIAVTKGHNHHDHGTIRLMGADNSYSGRIELFLNDTWSTVCNVGWDIRDAHVACKMAGFQEAQATYLNAAFGKGSGSILLSNVKCTGEEKSLFECAHSGYYAHACSHEEDVAVVCLYNPKDHTHIGRIVVIVLAVMVVIVISLFLNQHRRLSSRKRRHVTCRETVEFTCIALSSCCTTYKNTETFTASANGRAVSSTTTDASKQGRCNLRRCNLSKCNLSKCNLSKCNLRKCNLLCSKLDKGNSEKESEAKFSFAKFSNEGDGEPYRPSPISHDSISAPPSNSTVVSVHVPKTDEASFNPNIESSTDSVPKADSLVDSASKSEANLASTSKNKATPDNATKAEAILDTEGNKVETTLDRRNTTDAPVSTAISLDNTDGLSNSAYEPDYS
ncbi:uncharacterized protein [Amphiura filiformis]|uniref:uncharacterized protein n=1 Tax=Amphiura filiformis TaxID=82378 RepID=UPI003B2175FF